MSVSNIQDTTLSIRISTNGFCFCSYSPSQPDSLKYHFHPTDDDKSLAVNLRKAIDNCPLVNKDDAQQVKVIIETTEYTVIPAEYDLYPLCVILVYQRAIVYCFAQVHG